MTLEQRPEGKRGLILQNPQFAKSLKQIVFAHGVVLQSVKYKSICSSDSLLVVLLPVPDHSGSRFSILDLELVAERAALPVAISVAYGPGTL